MMKTKDGTVLEIVKKDAVKTKDEVAKTGGAEESAKALYDAEIASKIIDGMTKEQFHKTVLRGVAKNPAFGALVTFGAKSLSDRDKITVRAELAKIGIPASMTCDDESLDRIAEVVADRSIRLK